MTGYQTGKIYKRCFLRNETYNLTTDIFYQSSGNLLLLCEQNQQPVSNGVCFDSCCLLHPGVSRSHVAHGEMSDEISREGVSAGTSLANVLFSINMQKALKLPLIWKKKHLEYLPSIKVHTHRGCQDPRVLCVLHRSKELVLWGRKCLPTALMIHLNLFSCLRPEDGGLWVLGPGQPWNSHTGPLAQQTYPVCQMYREKHRAPQIKVKAVSNNCLRPRSLLRLVIQKWSCALTIHCTEILSLKSTLRE